MGCLCSVKGKITLKYEANVRHIKAPPTSFALFQDKIFKLFPELKIQGVIIKVQRTGKLISSSKDYMRILTEEDRKMVLDLSSKSLTYMPLTNWNAKAQLSPSTFQIKKQSRVICNGLLVTPQLALTPLPPEELHGDFHPFTVLFENNELTVMTFLKEDLVDWIPTGTRQLGVLRLEERSEEVEPVEFWGDVKSAGQLVSVAYFAEGEPLQIAYCKLEVPGNRDCYLVDKYLGPEASGAAVLDHKLKVVGLYISAETESEKSLVIPHWKIQASLKQFEPTDKELRRLKFALD